MTSNDKMLLKQMLEAGRFNWDIYALLVKHNEQQAKEKIEAMGESGAFTLNIGLNDLMFPYKY